MAKKESKKKVVLAYSGGLSSSPGSRKTTTAK